MNMREKTLRAQQRLIMRRAIDALVTSVASIEADDDVVDKRDTIRRQFADCGAWLRKSYAEVARGDEADDEDHRNEVDEDEGDGDADDENRGDDTFRGLGDGKTKEKRMDWQNIVKNHGFETVVKMIADDGESYGISEAELTALAVEHAKRQHPNLPADRAFARLHSESLDLRKALTVAKLTPADIMPTFVGGEEARSPNDPRSALSQLNALVAEQRKRFPEMTEAQVFARVYADAANRELVERERAESRPRGHPSWPPASERERVRFPSGE
jgi:hypothetical protein